MEVALSSGVEWRLPCPWLISLRLPPADCPRGAGRADLKRCAGVLREGVAMSGRYAAIIAHATQFDIRLMCTALDVSPCGCDAAVARTTAARLYLAVLPDLASRQPAAGLIQHTYRESQGASHDFRAVLAAHGIVQSMSRRGDCWDNAVAASFFATLEHELLATADFAHIARPKAQLLTSSTSGTVRRGATRRLAT